MSLQLICASHSPLMLTDIEESVEGTQKRFFSSLEETSRRLHEFSPDLIVLFGPDHFNGFFYEMMPPFCIGLAAEGTNDWGIRGRALRVPKDMALECARYLQRNDFDVAISHDMKVDHGMTVPLMQLTGALARYDVLPVFVNCAADPRPSFRRVRMLGEAIGNFLADKKDLNITLIGSGGLSHDPPTPRLDRTSASGSARLINRSVPTEEEYAAREACVVRTAHDLVNQRGPCLPPSEEWDKGFIRKLGDFDTEALDAITDREIDRLAGFGAHEVRTWVAATAAARALGEGQLQLDYYSVVPEWLTGMCIMSSPGKSA
ncbi:2,3-dihydroxyphenylpropionate 1,2-dioxygenase [Paenochrobactrum gallinarii]|uniref:2,3-dihydroxyphenylpropionate 1,2-dioxygenase n=1 Tax=Paenochrobactrum gallinarii TaxID=643673 RepID=A0A841M8T7_9HYPH|nr:3-carboxyethylcatechol 2,3-dioxygenase [Paenochrobactrum gallinarii]MBB6262548.1 2,3-dihydroxyphenylpropionate 1,2-dioxygenase [Paenochrobactrum gallinarii]